MITTLEQLKEEKDKEMLKELFDEIDIKFEFKKEKLEGLK